MIGLSLVAPLSSWVSYTPSRLMISLAGSIQFPDLPSYQQGVHSRTDPCELSDVTYTRAICFPLVRGKEICAG